MMIYLDNCATTRLRPEVKKAIIESYESDFANPSSLHRLGLEQENKIIKARKLIANSLGVEKEEIYFTSGGTESNNLAIQGGIKSQPRKKHIITSKIEHPSVLNTIGSLEKEGFIVDYLDVDSRGRILLEDLKNKINDNTGLISIMHVNNEIGIIQEISEISKIRNKKNPEILLHVDGVQAYGKINTNLKKLGVDLYSLSSHKIHGPKGIGGLYIKKDRKLDPIIYGGNQERGLRSGTENVQAIIGFGKATELMIENIFNDYEHVYELKKYMIDLIEANINGVRINSELGSSFSPYIISLSFQDVLGQVLLHYLQDKNIFVSTSSACSSKGTTESHVLKSIGLESNLIKGTIRVCLSYETKKEEIREFVSILNESIIDIRNIIR